jgi:hypothetical protein
VDEIQDYTQAEGSQSVDYFSAQSVVESVEFRFTEVRSVGHVLYAGDPRYVPDKPVAVLLTFQSHSGILNTACLPPFPRSANRLSPDMGGAFADSRPGIFHDISSQRLTELASRKSMEWCS